MHRSNPALPLDKQFIMETGFTIATILLVLFGLLATFDGVYLHIFKYRLYDHPESKFEHLTHTVRALLFPLILYFLFLQHTVMAFFIGTGLVVLDVLVLAADAFVEKDSRTFMGGLPRWEYIIHLFVNGFHFAAIAVFLVLRLDVGTDGLQLRSNFAGIASYDAFTWLARNLIPGGVFFGLLHVFVAFGRTASVWNRMTKKISGR